MNCRGGQPLVADDQNKDFRDLQELGRQTQLAGVMLATAITATGLTLGFGVGFLYFARQIWVASGTTSYSVPDEAITYLWGCADGILRPSASAATPPAGFDTTQACLLVKATAHLGVVTLDVSVQQRSRYADPAARKVTDGPLSLDYANNRVDVSAGALVLPVLAADPATLVDGMAWVNSATATLKYRVGGVTKVVTGS